MSERKAEEHKGEEGGGGENSGPWIFTYADMVTLLMAFFLILYTMSTVDIKKYKEMAASFQGGQQPSLLPKEAPTPMEHLASSMRLSNIPETNELTMDDRGVTVTMPASVLFDAGSANLSAAGVKQVEMVANILLTIPNSIVIEGHTDNAVPKNTRFASNWELSGARAASVAVVLEKFGIESSRMEITGYGSTRPRAMNETPALRSLNRRIDVLIKPK